MFKLKNKFKTIYLFFISFIAILFTINNHQVMAMENDKNKQKNNFDIVEEAVEKLSEGIEYFNKKEIQLNLNKITKLLTQNKKRKQKNEEKYINSANNKKIRK